MSYTRKDFDRTFEQTPPRGFYLVILLAFVALLAAFANCFNR